MHKESNNTRPKTDLTVIELVWDYMKQWMNWDHVCHIEKVPNKYK